MSPPSPLGVLLMTVSSGWGRWQACGSWETYPWLPGAGDRDPGILRSPRRMAGQGTPGVPLRAPCILRRSPAGSAGAVRATRQPSKAGTHAPGSVRATLIFRRLADTPPQTISHVGCLKRSIRTTSPVWARCPRAPSVCHRRIRWSAPAPA